MKLLVLTFACLPAFAFGKSFPVSGYNVNSGMCTQGMFFSCVSNLKMQVESYARQSMERNCMGSGGRLSSSFCSSSCNPSIPPYDPSPHPSPIWVQCTGDCRGTCETPSL